MKTNFTLLIIALIFANSFTFAQSAGESADMKDPKAKAVLDKLSAKNKTYTSIKASFEYILDNAADDIHESQTGSLLVSGDKYKLKIAGQEIINNGKTVWTYIADADEVQISNVSEDEEEGLVNPAQIFTIYEKGFKYKFSGEEGNTQTINLYPENANEKNYHTIQLLVDKTKTQITSIVIKSKDGNTYTYKLTKFEPNVATTDSDFNFDTSKVGDVIDLRD